MGRVNTTLIATDIAETLRFYTDVLGFREEFRWGDPVVEAGGVLLYGHSIIFYRGDKVTAAQLPQHGVGTGFYINLDGDESVDQYFERVRAKATVVSPLEEKPWGDRTFAVADPDGYRIEFAKSARRKE